MQEDRALGQTSFSSGIMHFVLQVSSESQFKAFLESNRAEAKAQRVKYSSAQQLVRKLKSQSVLRASFKA